jgi:8-oxo-dGTP diphosphatase
VDIASALDLPDLLPATYPPLRWLQIPDRYLISPGQGKDSMPAFLVRLRTALARGVRLVQWREPGWHGPDMQTALEAVLAICHKGGAKLLVNSAHDQALWPLADGVHFRAQDAKQTNTRPASLANQLVGVSAHTEQELHMARSFGADFAVLGPVLPTDSHPGASTLGWDGFESLQQKAGLPVFAIGGQAATMLGAAQSRGAHGIAGIRQIID